MLELWCEVAKLSYGPSESTCHLEQTAACKHRTKDFAGSLIKYNLICARFSGSLMSGVAPKNSTPVTGKLAHTQRPHMLAFRF